MGMCADAMLLYDTVPVDDGDAKKARDMRSAEDATLVDWAQGGDYAAFEELVRRYRNDVFALSYHYVRDREEAWDIAQEVFIKAHRALKRFRGDASFKTWLLRITANRCKDFFKKRRLPTVSMDQLQMAQAAPDASPRRNLEAQELGEAIDKALATLPEKHRTTFMLREFEGLSYEDMAKVMDVSIGTVMSRLHHARKKLQKALLAMDVVEDRRS